MKKVLITGSSGFIGFHISYKLLEEGCTVLGIDEINDYYNKKLKIDRTEILKKYHNFIFQKVSLEDAEKINSIISSCKPDIVIHLAAQAGVRYSLNNPRPYISSNIVGTFNVLEAVKNTSCKHLLIASSSSVYGGNLKIPYKEIDKTESQLSLYAATKKACENISHSYSHLYKIPITCLRFFTVYGPWGRPDMALFKFTKKILASQAIDIYDHGNMVRDFTYIDDVVNSVHKLLNVIPQNGYSDDSLKHDSLSSVAPWRVVNIGGAKPRKLMDLIGALENRLGIEAIKNYIPMQPGEVNSTIADVTLLRKLTGYTPRTDMNYGIDSFVNWYKNYVN